MAMELTSCTNTFIRGSIASYSRGATHGFCTYRQQQPYLCPPAPRSQSLNCSAKPSLWFTARRKSLPLYRAIEGNSTTESSKTADQESPPTEDVQETPQDSSSSSSGNLEEQESLGKALNQLRQERIASGKEDPSKTEDFWRGVLEETRLIEWPSLQKVLSTTGVVVSIIVGSSLVLLTVNAVLAKLSDAIFDSTPPPV